MQSLLRTRSLLRPNGARLNSTTELANEMLAVLESSIPKGGPASETYTGEKVHYKPWMKKRPGLPTKELYGFYSPNDFEQARRVAPKIPQQSKPSGLGPSAARAKLRDPFYQLDINPANEFRNAKLLSSFLTDMGMIKNRGATGLTRRNQRMLAKAVKRARNMGIIPTFSKPLDLPPEAYSR